MRFNASFQGFYALMNCSDAIKKTVYGATVVFTAVAFAYASPPLSRGARPIALGGAYVAEAGDGYSLFYNPAGLAEINQREVIVDYGRSASMNESSRSEFNGIYAMPYRWRDDYYPVAFGIYGEGPAPGAHIIDISAGAGGSAPIEKWTKGFIKRPTKVGLAATLRHQGGDTKSDRVGKSSIGLGLSGGAFMALDNRHKLGFALRNLFLGDSNPRGPSANLGLVRQHRDYVTLFAELEYASGGIWRFKPGAEWFLARGVVRPRLGWGFRDNGGVDSVATGVGFYVSPFQVDIAYLIPTKTLNDDTYQFRASLSYRFGRPQFSEIYYDRALEAASQLDNRVLGLTIKEAELKASVNELEQKRRLAREEMDTIKKRIETLKDQDLLGQRNSTIQQLKQRVNELEDQLSSTRHQNRQLLEKKETKRTHTVVAGETLQSLATQYYGDPNQWKKIYNANSDKIDRGLPRVGATLVIP